MRKKFISSLRQTASSDYIEKLLLLSSKNFPLLLPAMLYSLALLFVSSNFTLLIITAVCAVLMYRQTKNLPAALLAVFLLTLPFAKGKSWQIMLLAKEYVQQNPLFDISYFFPVYLSDVVLGCILWILLRRASVRKKLTQFPLPDYVLAFAAFIVFVSVTAINTVQPIVPLLSAFQLIKLLFVMIFPLFLTGNFSREKFTELISVSVLFQILLILLQTANRGPLGIYIESFLPNADFGITAFENRDLLRATGSFFEPSITGTFLLIQLTVLWLFSKQTIDRRHRQLIAFTLLTALPALILTGSRGIYVLSIPLFFDFLKTLFQKQLKTDFPKILIGFGIGALILLGPYLVSRLENTNQLFSRFGSGTYRLQIGYYSVQIAAEKLFGTGLSLSPYEFATMPLPDTVIFDPAYAHNIFLQILAETGFFGLGLFILFLSLLYRHLQQNRSLRNPFTAGAAVFLICAQIYPIFLNHPEILSYFFLYIGLANRYKSFAS